MGEQTEDIVHRLSNPDPPAWAHAKAQRGPEARCKHELILDQCGLCRPRPPASPPASADPFESAADVPPRSGPGPWVPAQFDGECSGCDGALWVGEDIRADGSGGWEGRCCE